MINKAVKDWCKNMEQEPSLENAKLYLKLIGEEYLELMMAVNDKNYTETLDALSDLKWVITGSQIMLGEDPDHLDGIVATSNNSKFIDQTDMDVIEDSISKYERQEINVYAAGSMHDFNNKVIIRRVEDNKVLKPTTFQEPDWSSVTPPDYWDQIN